jgi:hypothetical protein
VQLDKRISQVVIWGHPLHTNTFSYVNEAMFRAFRHMGYPAAWLDGKSTVDVKPGTLFFTEGQVDQHIPIRDDCWYIVHNWKRERYPQRTSIAWQTYTDDVFTHHMDKINDWTYWQEESRVLCQPWATNLLPHEIGQLAPANTREVHWVGTIGAGEFGNINEINGVKRACAKLGLSFHQHVNISWPMDRELIRSSALAPAVTGTWQTKKNYVPCRAFKVVSYGHWLVTNNAKVMSIFGGNGCYAEDTETLMLMAAEHCPAIDRRPAMEMVKKHHTFINRIETVLRFL